MQPAAQKDLKPDRQAGLRPPSRRKLGRPTLSDEELLDVALDLFLENGFEGTTLEAIAGAASMAKRTIYARYDDKEALFRAALSRAIDAWIVPVDRLRELETDDLEETLLGIAELLLANILSPLGLQLFRLTNTVSERMPDIALRNVRQGTQPTVDFLADLFERRVDFASQHFIDPTQAAFSFIHLVVGGPSSMAAWGLQFDQDTIDRHARSSVKLFLGGLLPREEAESALAEENRLLRQMLTDALLENAALRQKDEALTGAGPRNREDDEPAEPKRK